MANRLKYSIMLVDQPHLIHHIAQRLTEKKWSIATAESCTGGWIAQVLTSIPGSSKYFERGFVTYTNMAKHEMLGVPTHILASEGAVSESTARAMAEGALKHSHAQVSLSVTGIAGPEGGTAEKPVGLVWFAWASKFFPTIASSRHFRGERGQIREHAVIFALEQLLKLIS